MDAYPIELITHEAPLLLLSGLGGKEKYTEIPQFPLLNQGPLVASHLPSLTDETSERLLEFFLKQDVTGIWGRRPEAGLKINQRPVFRVRAVGRVCFSMELEAGLDSSTNRAANRRNTVYHLAKPIRLPQELYPHLLKVLPRGCCTHQSLRSLPTLRFSQTARSLTYGSASTNHYFRRYSSVSSPYTRTLTMPAYKTWRTTG
jgi:hypothetical protein